MTSRTTTSERRATARTTGELHGYLRSATARRARGHVPFDDDASGSTVSVNPSTLMTRTGVPRSSELPSAGLRAPFLAGRDHRAERAQRRADLAGRARRRRAGPDRHAGPMRRERIAPNDDQRHEDRRRSC